MTKKRTPTRNITKADIAAAKRLKELWVKKAPVKQKEAAQWMGCTPGAISSWLNGHTVIGPVALLKFAKLLDVDPKEIRPDFEFDVLPSDIPPDVARMALKLASFPKHVREDFELSIDQLSKTNYVQFIANTQNNHNKSAKSLKKKEKVK